jgi:hypothetical protein
MDLAMRSTFSASNSGVALPDINVEAVLDSSIFALGSAVTGMALALAAVVWLLDAALVPVLAGAGAVLSAWLPIFMVLSKDRGEGSGHSICTVYRPLLERL